jgi:replicative DNA helicase
MSNNNSHQSKTQNLATDPGAPFSQESEEAVIGSILINPEAYISVSAFLKSSDFFMLRHQYIWQAFERLSARSEPIDQITLAEELENMQVLETIGGRAYIIQLSNHSGTSMYAEVYGRLVERTSLRRKMMVMSDDIKKLAMDESLNIDTVRSEAESKFFATMQASTERGRAVQLWEGLSDYYDTIEALMQNSNTIGIPSGFRDIDALLGGYQRSDMITIAARPGVGKTSYLMGTAMNVARFGGHVAVFSMEMGQAQVITRILAMETGINVQKLRLGKLNPQEASRFTEAIGRLSKWKLFLNDTPALTPAELRSSCRRLKIEHGLDMVIIDYIQLMNAEARNRDRTQEVAYISRTIKELAKELNVPILAAAQLNRELEHRKDKRPILSDLKESGGIEQDSDIVQFIYRDEMYNPDTEFPNQAEIITAKHRNGPTGITSLYFEKSLTKFMDASVHRVDISNLE